MQEHAATLKRTIKVINLDPAAEKFDYTCDIDVRELITVKDVMEKFKYGPNGALIYCLE
jgi:GTPase SAR1 family protein